MTLEKIMTKINIWAVRQCRDPAEGSQAQSDKNPKYVLSVSKKLPDLSYYAIRPGTK
jgi:hypothetical protein